MPLHLLGKKSWNVYNTDNIARVRRDEAAAKAREEEEERRMQEADAERRMQLLRGSDEPSNAQLEDHHDHTKLEPDLRHSRKRKRRPGEDDTERDIRLAREDARDLALSERSNAMSLPKSAHDAPLVDRKGHISLFPEQRTRSHVEKNAEAEAEAAKKRREYEDQFTMRFSNAAGFKQGMANPWYASLEQDGSTETPVDRDVWGNGEHRRQERQRMKMQDEDPLSSMRKGVQEVKKVEKERKKWIESREKEMREIERMERKRRRKSSKHPRHHHSEEDIEPLDLDASAYARDTRYHSPDEDSGHGRRRKHHHDDHDRRRDGLRRDSDGRDPAKTSRRDRHSPHRSRRLG